jgi:hypothetical protein
VEGGGPLLRRDWGAIPMKRFATITIRAADLKLRFVGLANRVFSYEEEGSGWWVNGLGFRVWS